jgi:hypothetical protein
MQHQIVVSLSLLLGRDGVMQHCHWVKGNIPLTFLAMFHKNNQKRNTRELSCVFEYKSDLNNSA